MCNKLYRLIYVLKLHVSQQLLKVIVVPVVIKISCFTNYQIQRYMVEDNKIVMKFDCYSSRTKIIMKNFRTKIFFQVYDKLPSQRLEDPSQRLEGALQKLWQKIKIQRRATMLIQKIENMFLLETI
jgi:hypothetical protein